MDLSSAEREALDRLLPRDRQTGDLKVDLIAAGQETKRRREQNSIDGGHVFAALHRLTKSWAIVAFLVDLPKSTVINWFRKMAEAVYETDETPNEEA